MKRTRLIAAGAGVVVAAGLGIAIPAIANAQSGGLTCSYTADKSGTFSGTCTGSTPLGSGTATFKGTAPTSGSGGGSGTISVSSPLGGGSGTFTGTFSSSGGTFSGTATVHGPAGVPVTIPFVANPA